jgi:hypothetical protein
MIEAILIAVAFVAVIVALVHDPDGRESRPVSLEPPSASRAERHLEKSRR